MLACSTGTLNIGDLGICSEPIPSHQISSSLYQQLNTHFCEGSGMKQFLECHHPHLSSASHQSSSLSLQQQSETPLSSPLSQQPEPLLSQQSSSQLSQQFGSPTNIQPDSPVSQQSESLLSQQSSSPLSQQFGSPTNSQPDSPVSQQSHSPFQENDEEMSNSPASSQESALSPASTNHGSPSGRTNTRTQEYNSEIEKGESLNKEQISLMRQKREAQEKVDMFGKWFNSMTHCKCCLDDNHNVLIQNGDYALDIILEESKLQSCSSQSSLFTESLEEMNNNPGSFVMDLLTPSNSMTNFDIRGKFTQDLVALEFCGTEQTCNNFEIETTTAVTEHNEWSSQPQLTYSISDEQNTNPSNSQRNHEVNKILAYLEADRNTHVSMKRRNGFGDTNENCIKNTKQDCQTVISTPLHEKNGQYNVSVTEEKPRRCTPTKRANGKRLVHQEVCIKQNKENNLIQCLPESAVETKNNTSGVESVEESLIEKFTSAVSLNKNLAGDVTDTVKDVKSSSQSGLGETLGINNLNESFTETSSITKTGDEPNVYLLEKTMETLSIGDRNEVHAKSGINSTATTEVETNDSLLEKSKETSSVGDTKKITQAGNPKKIGHSDTETKSLKDVFNKLARFFSRSK